jgi:amphi-Trp domain-containing protein
MKRRKSKFVDQRGIEACIDQLQSIIDGLRAGRMAVEEEDQALLLRPRGPLDFELRVDQLGTKETLRVEMSWKLASQRTAGASVAPASGPREVSAASAWEGPVTIWPEREPLEAEAPEMEVHEADILDADLLEAADAVPATMLRPIARTVAACTCSTRSLEDPISSWPQQRSIADEYHQLYADACTVGGDGQWHIDRDRLVQSLANAGVDPLTQQELYSLALQADVDRTSLFSERVVAALERASQRPLAAAV